MAPSDGRAEGAVPLEGWPSDQQGLASWGFTWGFSECWALSVPSLFCSVEGEYVPVEGDEVTYKMCSIPPKNEKLQAVEVVITHLAPGTKHETWSGHVVSS